MVVGGACVRGCGGGMHGCRGVCMVVEHVHGCVGGVRWIQRDTVNERAVRILLECILLIFLSFVSTSLNSLSNLLSFLHSSHRLFLFSLVLLIMSIRQRIKCRIKLPSRRKLQVGHG